MYSRNLVVDWFFLINFRFKKNYRRVRTLYACLAENDGELSFEPNQIITNGKHNRGTK